MEKDEIKDFHTVFNDIAKGIDDGEIMMEEVINDVLWDQIKFAVNEFCDFSLKKEDR